MRLTATHQFGAPLARVLEAMGSSEFYEGLRLPDIEPPEVVARSANGNRVDMHVRFTYTGKLDPVARRVVGKERVTWVQRLEIDPEAGAAALSVDPDVGVIPAGCSGRFALHDTDADTRCIRTFEGDLRVRVPIIGSRAEKSLAPGILRRLDLEAAALDEYARR